MGEQDYIEVTSFIQRFIRRTRWVKGAEGLCLLWTAVLLLFALGIGVDKIKIVFPYAPLFYSFFATTSIVLLATWTVYQCTKKRSKEWAARTIEEKLPNLKNDLINSIQLYSQIVQNKNEPGLSVSMVLALLSSTRQQLMNINIGSLLNIRQLYAQIRLLGFLLVPVLILVLFNPSFVSDSFSLIIHPLKDVTLYEAVLDVAPKGIRIERGSAVTVLANSTGTISKVPELVWSPAGIDVEGNSYQQTILMEKRGRGGFSSTINEIREDLRYRVKTGSFASPWYTIEVVDPPKIGNVGVTLHPPHYTGLDTQILQGGNVEGIKGSNLHFTALSTKVLLKAKILLEEGKEIPLKVDGRKVKGNLVLFRSQKYQIMAETPDGFYNSPIIYRLRVLPDTFPTINLRQPKEDLEVNGDEVLSLEYSARDDYGIHEVTLVTKAQGKAARYPILKNKEGRSILRERFQWDLFQLGLRAGSEIIYHLEVHDNDTITGPKVGLSQSLSLRIKDLKSKHKQITAIIQDLSNRMIDLLADHLEKPPILEQDTIVENKIPSSRVDKKVNDLMQILNTVLQRTEKDRLSKFSTWSDLQSLKSNLEFTKDELLMKIKNAPTIKTKLKLHDQISGELERMSMLAENIGKRLTAQDITSAADELIKSQKRLMNSLDKLKRKNKNLDSILKEISNLAKQLQSLQQSLTRFASSLPQDFTNRKSIKNLRFNNMLSALNKIRKKLEEGDIKASMELARDLFNQLASMVASLRNTQQMVTTSMMGRMQGEMVRTSSVIGQIVRDQQAILLETEGIYKEQQVKQAELLKKNLNRFRKIANKELSHLAQLFPDLNIEEEQEIRQESSDIQIEIPNFNYFIKNLRIQLKNKDIAALVKGLHMTRSALKKAFASISEGRKLSAEKSLKKILEEIKALKNKSTVDPMEKKKNSLQDLAYRQGLLKDQTEDLHQKLISLFQLFPSLDPKIIRNIYKATKMMVKARERLTQLIPKEAITYEQNAIEFLSQSHRRMQNSMQRLVQRGQLGQLPLVYLFRRGRFLPSGKLVPLPGIPKFPQFDIREGVTGLDTEKFQLPGKEDYKVPRKFREEMIESLKQGIPDRYKEQIESYFKDLSQ